MHLKSLRLQGFKTFARRTELNFSTGITAIVGPNGSGKSNLVDAIRWALGERNARGLRGHRMEDVIYAGGPGKSAVGMAEVTLVLDNADQRLNVEFTEIEVARRLFRSGESEYLVNGSRARLKDIDALLASTGLRQDGYAVTAQNDIDFVIQAAPAMRRELIEEAAGVRRLRDQRQEAVNRLAEADRDMRRARDILNELTPRADDLRLQAEAAQEYNRIAETLKGLQGSLARDAWRKAMVQLRRAASRLQSAEHKRAAVAEAVAVFEPLYREHRQSLLDAREARWRNQESLADVRLRLAEAQHQARIAEERNLAAVHALEALQRELVRLMESEQAGSRVVAELQRAAEEAKVELEAATGALVAAANDERQAIDADAALEVRAASLKEQRHQVQGEALAVEAELRQLEGRLQFLHEQEAQLAHQLEGWASHQQTLELELDSRRSVSEAMKSDLSEASSAVSQVEAELVEVDTALEAARRAVTEQEAQLRSLEAQLGALRTLLDGAQRRGPLPRTENWERLLELIQVDSEHRPAVEAALEGWLHAWVARDRAAYEEAASRLCDAEHARETLLWAEGDRALETLPDGVRPVLDVIHATGPVRVMLADLLLGVVLVANRDEAAALIGEHPQLRAVTAAGEMVTAVAYRGGKAADPVLSTQARIRETEAALDQERIRSLAAAEEVERSMSTRSRLLSEREIAIERLTGIRTRSAEAVGALAAVSEAMERQMQQGAQLREQRSRLQQLLEQAAAMRVTTLERHAGLGDRDAKTLDALQSIQAQLGDQASTVRTAIGRRQEAELRAALARQRSDDLFRQLERAQQLLQAQGSELAQRRVAEEQLAVQPSIINEERRQWIDRADALKAELAGLESMPLPNDAAVDALERQLHEDEQRNVSLQVDLAHAEDAYASALAERDDAQADVERCAAALRQDGQPLDDSADVEEVDWQKTEREVSRLQRRLDSMGPVNLLAPDEYGQLQERCESLTTQLSDLEQAASQLSELRQHLEEDIDSRFRAVFQAVAVNFQEFFGELFPGGRATLRLESDEQGSPLDDGVEILAQTPGKRLQPLTLLSGGERALTALAFLFGLQAVNPSPFYVLDEVDAALDDANVVRFNRVLKRLAADQQFLVVTHNHSTMAQAEALYGVTLGEHGISRIVSVRLHQDTLVPLAERSA